MLGSYVMFKKDISDKDLRVICKANTVYKCVHFDKHRLYLEQHDRYRYYLDVRFELSEELITLVYETEEEREEGIKSIFQVICAPSLLKEMEAAG